MNPAPGISGLWQIAASDCGFADDDIIHYCFEVEDTHRDVSRVVRCTDPCAHTVDWRLTADSGNQPAAVVQFAGNRLILCDPGGEKPDFSGDVPLDRLPPNNTLVIYELPTAWTRSEGQGQRERAAGTFRDVRALLDETVGGANFEALSILKPGHSYLKELGVNALELLPPADSFFKREWGYDTAHFLAPDHDLGFPEGNSSSTANSDLAALVVAANQRGIRFFADMVMAFGRVEPTQTIDFDDFCISLTRDDQLQAVYKQEISVISASSPVSLWEDPSAPRPRKARSPQKPPPGRAPRKVIVERRRLPSRGVRP